MSLGSRRRSTFSSPGGMLKMVAHLPNFIKLYWRLFTDRRVSLLPKIILVAGLVYLISPIDLIPDFPLIGLGDVDDAVVMWITCRLFIALIPRRIVEEHVQLIDQGL